MNTSSKPESREPEGTRPENRGREPEDLSGRSEAGVPAMLQKLGSSIEEAILHDPGTRGLEQWASRGDLLPAALSLFEGKRIAIATGFYVASAETIETDGPPGASVLAGALAKLGKEVELLVDDHASTVIRAGLADHRMGIRLLKPDQPLDPLEYRHLTHLVAVERPGRSRSGRYYTFRGLDISPFVAPVDDLFIAAERTYMTVGIGDGGNELGLCHVSDRVARHVANGGTISCQTPADYCICAGVSNWGAYGLAAMLAAVSGRDLLPPPGEVTARIKALVEAGAVDGVTARADLSVDGVTVEWEETILRRLRGLVAGHARRSRRDRDSDA
jgi:hypothetical protein